MRFYRSVGEAIPEIERDMVEMGVDVWTKSVQNMDVRCSPEFQSKELIGYSFKVTDTSVLESIEAASKHHRVPIEMVEGYCVTEMRDRLNPRGVNPGASYKIRPEVWDQFLKPTGRFDYTYSERIGSLTPPVIHTLMHDIATRQAVVSVWRPLDLMNTGGRERIPCSLYYQFLWRLTSEKKSVLTVIYSMRSCDLYTHFGFDVTLAIMYANYINISLPTPAHRIDLIMFMGSLHAFRKDYEPRGVF